VLSGAVIMIIRWHSARDGASRLTMPVPDGRRRARNLAWQREWHGECRLRRDHGAVSSPGPRASAADARPLGVGRRAHMPIVRRSAPVGCYPAVTEDAAPDLTCQAGPVPDLPRCGRRESQCPAFDDRQSQPPGARVWGVPKLVPV